MEKRRKYQLKYIKNRGKSTEYEMNRVMIFKLIAKYVAKLGLGRSQKIVNLYENMFSMIASGTIGAGKDYFGCFFLGESWRRWGVLQSSSDMLKDQFQR